MKQVHSIKIKALVYNQRRDHQKSLVEIMILKGFYKGLIVFTKKQQLCTPLPFIQYMGHTQRIIYCLSEIQI